MHVSVTDAKGQLTDLVRRAEAGDEIILTRHGHAIVRLEYAALNHRDVWIRKGQYAGLRFPIILGSDGSGVVESADRDEWVGKQVIINPSFGWGESERAQKAETFKILGLPQEGTFAERVKVPIENLANRPKHLSSRQAAALPLAGLTAYRALFSRANLAAGQKVLVTGAGGGVASFAIQMAHAAGASVWVTTSSEQKLEFAHRLGAAGGVNYREEDWDKSLKQQAGGFEVIIDGAGGLEYNKLADLAFPGGTIVSYGATLGAVPNLELRRVFWKQLNLRGTTMGSPRDFQQMVEFLEAHQIVPAIDEEFPLAEANAALDRMESAQQTGKIVLRI